MNSRNLVSSILPLAILLIAAMSFTNCEPPCNDGFGRAADGNCYRLASSDDDDVADDDDTGHGDDDTGDDDDTGHGDDDTGDDDDSGTSGH